MSTAEPSRQRWTANLRPVAGWMPPSRHPADRRSVLEPPGRFGWLGSLKHCAPPARSVEAGPQQERYWSRRLRHVGIGSIRDRVVPATNPAVFAMAAKRKQFAGDDVCAGSAIALHLAVCSRASCPSCQCAAATRMANPRPPVDGLVETVIERLCPVPREGRWPSSRTLGWDAVDAAASGA
jgi:hypothetical protein